MTWSYHLSGDRAEGGGGLQHAEGCSSSLLSSPPEVQEASPRACSDTGKNLANFAKLGL